MNHSIIYFVFVLFALSFADNANNVTILNTSSSDIYCKSQILLYNKILNCRQHKYCCNLNVYETQFNNENNKCTHNTSTLCNNLASCRNSCKNKIPSYYSCISGNTNERYTLFLNNCYEKCFDNEYKCPNSKKSQQKYFGIVETIIVVIVLGTFAICVARYTCFENFHLKHTRKSSFSSKVHIASTSNDFSNV